MHFAAMIQARYGSSRLPGKILMDLCGKPVLQRVIERVQKSRYMDEVLVVTSIEAQNLQVMRLCADLGVRVFAGSENDVLDRYYQMAKLLQPEYVVRITADCPCFDWALLDQAVEFLNPDTDYMANLCETLPDGLDLEIIKFSALKGAWEQARLASEREHVTQYIRKHPEQYRQQNFASPIPDIGHLRWTLDEAEDYTLIHAIYEHFIQRGIADSFRTQDILDFLDEHPELAAVNAKYARNEGLAKSLLEDRITDQI